VGGARTALFNWAFARRHGGSMVLRIEDTDPERSTREYERAILDGLSWLGIDWDEGPDVGGPYGPYRQSERVERHRQRAEQLLQRGLAYPCFCSAERLEELRAEQARTQSRQAYDRRCVGLSAREIARRHAAGESSVLRCFVPEGHTTVADLVRGEVRFEHSEVDDWVMLRSDGAPTYNFVVVCDDVDMAISHVIRGEEHLINTPKQVLLYAAFGAQPPAFAHLPLMLGLDKKKLSKRTGDTAVEEYRAQGYPARALANFLCLQGWALDGKHEIFSVEQLVERFALEDVAKSGAIFDLDKLRWLSGQYIRRESVAELADHCAPFLVGAGLIARAELERSRAWYERLAACEQERLTTYADLAQRSAWLFADEAAGRPLVWDEAALAAAKKQPAAAETLRDFALWLREQLSLGRTKAELREGAKAWITARGAKLPALFQPLRLALTGQSGGLDLFDALELLGSERALARIDAAAARLAAS
jgi:glutamyl-tRNA synthetase